MAIIENFISRKEMKEMGNVVCYMRYGKCVLRTKPFDRKTPAQLAQRMRLRKLQILVCQVLKYINMAYAGSAKGKSAYNRVLSINMKNCYIDNTSSIDPSLFVLCENDGSFVDNVVLSSTVANTITVTFDSNTQNDDEGTDPVKAYGFYADGNKIWQFEQTATRSTGAITLIRPEMSALNISVYFECLDRVNLLNGNPRHVIKYVGTAGVI
jgi:hypothetical protein